MSLTHLTHLAAILVTISSRSFPLERLSRFSSEFLVHALLCEEIQHFLVTTLLLLKHAIGMAWRTIGGTHARTRLTRFVGFFPCHSA